MSYTDVIDEWISIVDARKALEAARKEAQGMHDSETQESLNWHNNQFSLWLDKSQLGLLAKERKRKRASSPSSDGGGCDEGGGSEAGDSKVSWSVNSISTPSIEGRKRRKRGTLGNSFVDNDLP